MQYVSSVYNERAKSLARLPSLEPVMHLKPVMNAKIESSKESDLYGFFTVLTQNIANLIEIIYYTFITCTWGRTPQVHNRLGSIYCRVIMEKSA